MDHNANTAVGVRIGRGTSNRAEAFRAIAGHLTDGNWKTDRCWSGLHVGLPIIAAASGQGQGLFLVGALIDAERAQVEDPHWGYRHRVCWQPEVFSARIDGVIARIVSVRELVWLTDNDYREALGQLTANRSAMARVSEERRLLALRAKRVDR
ncbi:MAG: hypothetical protein JWP07_5075 [Pseudonocardiales bacterium]|nr:hypothetical protein [Pseudonocardiales bacterium]